MAPESHAPTRPSFPFSGPVTGDDLLGPFLDRRPGRRAAERRSEPGNLAFTDGLDDWIIGGSFQAGVTGSHGQDYSAATADGTAILCATVPRPYGDAFLGQVLIADDYRGATVTFGGEVRTEAVASHAELFLFIVTRDRRQGQDVDVIGEAVTGSQGWARNEVTAQVPGDVATWVNRHSVPRPSG